MMRKQPITMTKEKKLLNRNNKKKEKTVNKESRWKKLMEKLRKVKVRDRKNLKKKTLKKKVRKKVHD